MIKIEGGGGGGRTKFFKGGPIFSEDIGPPGPGLGGLFEENQLIRDSSRGMPLRIRSNFDANA